MNSNPAIAVPEAINLAVGRQLAPIALFAYKRPTHLQRTLEALHRDPLFSSSPLHIYCDGARSDAERTAVAATRSVAREYAPPHARLVFRDFNLGLRRSIVKGVSELTAEHGRVVVVEDDLVVGKQFLGFMNAALDRYANDEAVHQVSGHFFPVQLPDTATPLLMPFTTTWGWATWKRAWQHFDPAATGYRHLLNDRVLRNRFNLDGSYPYFHMLELQQAGEIESWGILWYLSVFMRGGLTVFPRHSLVANEGFDGSGTNCSASSGQASQSVGWQFADAPEFPCDASTDRVAYEIICRHLADGSSLRRRVLRRASAYLTRIQLL